MLSFMKKDNETMFLMSTLLRNTWTFLKNMVLSMAFQSFKKHKKAKQNITHNTLNFFN